jgi:hypothetical protein
MLRKKAAIIKHKKAAKSKGAIKVSLVPEKAPILIDYSNIIKDYIEVPADKFNNIMPGDYIKYLKKTGEFREGGYVWYAKTNKENNRFWMISGQKEIETSSKIFKYPVFWNKINKVWIKPHQDMADVKSIIDTSMKDFNKLKPIILRQQYAISDMDTFLSKMFPVEYKKHKAEQDKKRRAEVPKTKNDEAPSKKHNK